MVNEPYLYPKQPEFIDDVPYCSEDCVQHDGKRCGILGCRPDGICSPAVKAIVIKARVVLEDWQDEDKLHWAIRDLKLRLSANPIDWIERG